MYSILIENETRKNTQKKACNMCFLLRPFGSLLGSTVP